MEKLDKFLNEAKLVYAFIKVSCAKSSLSSVSPNVWCRKKRLMGGLVLFDQSIKRPGVFKDHHLCYQRYVVDLAHFYSSLWGVSILFFMFCVSLASSLRSSSIFSIFIDLAPFSSWFIRVGGKGSSFFFLCGVVV